MPKQTAIRILDFCSSPKLSQALDSIIATVNANSEDEMVIKGFFDTILEELTSMSEIYLESLYSISDVNDIAALKEQFQEQLSYFWISIQSKFIRLNNFGNFKFSLFQEDDRITQAKASICSLFLEPIGKEIQIELLESQLLFIKSLLKRANFVS